MNDQPKSRRIKFLFKVVNGATPQSSVPEYWDGDIPWITPEDIANKPNPSIYKTRRRITKEGYESCGTTLAPKGSIVLSTRAPIGNMGILEVELCSNQGCKILIPNKLVIPKFGYYSLFAYSDYLVSLGQGSTFRELSSDSLKNTAIPIFPLTIQKAIATYLDKETARIDALIAKKERQIDLLQEKRQAIITRAISKGLDPNVKKKDSGVEWIGEIPDKWEVRRLKYISLGTTVGIVINPSSYYQYDGVVCLRSLNISSGVIDLNESVFISEESNKLLCKSILHEGDVVVVRTGKAGTPVIIPKEHDGCNCIDLLIIRKTKKMLSEYIYYYLKSDLAKLQVNTNSVGTIQSHFNTETLTEMVFTFPSIEEQREVIMEVKEIDMKIEKTLNVIAKSVALLREYRSSLITATVSGQKEVGIE